MSGRSSRWPRPQASINDSEFIGTNLQNAFIGTTSIADSDFSGADLMVLLFRQAMSMHLIQTLSQQNHLP